MTASLDFSIEVTIECDQAVFDDWILDGTTHQISVKDEPLLLALGPLGDNVSSLRGTDSHSFCGKRVYEIVDDSRVASFVRITDTDNIMIDPISQDETGSYTIQVRASMVDYPSVEALATVTIEVNPCQV